MKVYKLKLLDGRTFYCESADDVDQAIKNVGDVLITTIEMTEKEYTELGATSESWKVFARK